MITSHLFLALEGVVLYPTTFHKEISLLGVTLGIFIEPVPPSPYPSSGGGGGGKLGLDRKVGKDGLLVIEPKHLITFSVKYLAKDEKDAQEDKQVSKFSLIIPEMPLIKSITSRFVSVGRQIRIKIKAFFIGILLKK